MVDRAIGTPKNEDGNTLNNEIIDKLIGNDKICFYIDYFLNDTQHLYYIEFLNFFSFGGLSSHDLKSRHSNRAATQY